MGRTPRKFSAEFKAKVVLDILTNGKSLGQACREYSIKDSILSRQILSSLWIFTITGLWSSLQKLLEKHEDKLLLEQATQ